MSDPVSFRTDPAAAMARYLEDGVFIEPDVLTPAECDRLIEAAQSLPTARDGTLTPVMQVHRIEPKFHELMGHPRLVAMMDTACGGPVVGVQTQFYFTP